jgi:LEA14-like dessication related protein
MQNMNRVLALILLAGMIASCGVMQNIVEKPTLHVEEVKFHPISLQEGRLDSRLRIHNPNGFVLPLRKVSYQLKLNGREFIHNSLSFNKNIQATGAMEIQLPVRFRYAELLNGIRAFLQHDNIRFQLTGEVDVGLIRIPFSKTGEFSLTLPAKQ